MAIFNPDVPNTSDPNYLGWSKPIEQPEANKSLGIALKGVGDFIESGAKAVDFSVKQGIEDEIYAKANINRDVFTDALAQKKEQLAQGPGAPMSIVPPTEIEAAIPSDISNGMATLTSLEGGKDAGKVSSTYYWQRLNTLSQDLRSRYPGYRDYIDETVSKITGHNPANAYMQSIITDINRMSSQSGNPAQKTLADLHEMNKKGIPGANVMIDAITAGRATYSQGNQWINERTSQEYQRKTDEDNLRLSGMRREDQAMSAKDFAYKTGHDMVSNYLSDFFRAGGLWNPEQVSKAVNDVLEGRAKLTSDQAVQLKLQSQAWQDQIKKDFYQKMTRIGEDGKSVMSMIGGGKGDGKGDLDAIFSNIIKPLSITSDALQSGRIDVASIVQHRMEAQSKDTQYNLLNNSPQSMNGYLRVMQALEAMHLPDESKAYYKSNLDKIHGGDKALTEFYRSSKMEFATQRDIREAGMPGYTDQPANPPKTIKSSVDTLEQKGIKNPRMYSDFVNIAANIAKPDVPDEAKKNYAIAAFSPQGLGLVSKFPNEYTDEKGRTVPGRYSVFTMMTQPGVTSEIKRLSEKYPEVKNMYVDWAQKSFGSELFQNEIKNLNDYEKNLPGMRIMWNTDTHKFQWDFPGANSTDVTQRRGALLAAQVAKPVVESLSRLNMGLESMGKIAETFGYDKEAYLIGLMKDVGWNPQHMGAVGAMGRAIINSRTPPQSPNNDRTEEKTKEGSPDTSRFQQEARIPSVKEWVKGLERRESDIKPQARAEVLPGKTRSGIGWWGDTEAEAAGLYEPTKRK